MDVNDDEPQPVCIQLACAIELDYSLCFTPGLVLFSILNRGGEDDARRRVKEEQRSQCSRNSGHSDPGAMAACSALLATSSVG